MVSGLQVGYFVPSTRELYISCFPLGNSPIHILGRWTGKYKKYLVEQAPNMPSAPLSSVCLFFLIFICSLLFITFVLAHHCTQLSRLRWGLLGATSTSKLPHAGGRCTCWRPRCGPSSGANPPTTTCCNLVVFCRAPSRPASCRQKPLFHHRTSARRSPIPRSPSDSPRTPLLPLHLAAANGSHGLGDAQELHAAAGRGAQQRLCVAVVITVSRGMYVPGKTASLEHTDRDRDRHTGQGDMLQ